MSKQGSSDARGKAGPLAAFLREVQLYWRLLRDKRVPAWAKSFPLVALLYVIFPFDLITDLLPALGQLDDLAILALGMEMMVSLSPAEVVQQIRQEIRAGRSRPGAGQKQDAPVDTVDATYRVVDDGQEGSSGRSIDTPGTSLKNRQD